MTDKEIISTYKMICKMGGTEEPFGLFEPCFWKDKIDDSLWHCAINSCDKTLIHKTGETLGESVRKCYREFVKINQIK